MNKTELIDHIAKQADISKAAAGRALEAIVGGIRSSLKKGNSVTLVGFGTFAVGKRADLLVLDRELNVRTVYRDGHRIWVAE